jgi:hypothetical protein
VLSCFLNVLKLWGVTGMTQKAHLLRPGFLAWLLLLSVFVSQSPAASKVKNKPALKPESPITVHVSPAVAIEGSAVQATVRVVPNSDNRLLRIMVDSENYFRSSDVELNGDDAATTHYLALNSLPAGEYSFVAVVYGTHGERARIGEEFRLVSRQEPD